MQRMTRILVLGCGLGLGLPGLAQSASISAINIKTDASASPVEVDCDAEAATFVIDGQVAEFVGCNPPTGGGVGEPEILHHSASATSTKVNGTPVTFSLNYQVEAPFDLEITQPATGLGSVTKGANLQTLTYTPPSTSSITADTSVGFSARLKQTTWGQPTALVYSPSYPFSLTLEPADVTPQPTTGCVTGAKYTYGDGTQRTIVCKTANKGQDLRNIYIDPSEVHVYSFVSTDSTHNITISQGLEKAMGASTNAGDVQGDVWTDLWQRGLCTFGPAMEGAVTVGTSSYHCRITLGMTYYISVYTVQSNVDIYNIGF